MALNEVDGQLSELRRKEIFAALVEVQDQAVPVLQSRQVIAKQFGITERDIRRIETEGLNEQWPPL